MGKSKKVKGISDAVHAKKGASSEKRNPFSPAAISSKKTNPFEVHVNREKFNILGRTCKHDKGLPGVSRAKAIKKRKETLGKEHSTMHKTNTFRDNRIGRYGEITDEVMNARFLAEKMSQMRQGKASRFNLNDDEVLTHRGQTLAEIEQFRDDRSDDDDEEGLDADFTEIAHFGGDNEQAPKDRQTAIDEMIVEQKRRKLEMMKEKEEVHELTEKLDSNYKSLVGVMGKMSKDERQAKPAPDDYDKIMREMIFEPRGAVTDKLISEEDQAKKEKQRLEQLENERLKRMKFDGEEVEENAKPTHRSADDLDDGYFAQEVAVEQKTLSYNLDGELNSHIINGNNDLPSSSDDDEDDEEDDEGEEEEEEGSDDESGNGSENESEEDDNNMNDLNDLKESDSDSNDETEQTTTAKPKESKKTKSKSADASNKIENDDIPYTLEMPKTYATFQKLLSTYSPEKQTIVIDRLIKCNHPKLDVVNRENVVKLFAFLLQYINELFAEATEENVTTCFKTLNCLSPSLYDLMHLNPERMSTTLLNVIKEKYAEYRKNPKIFPSLDAVIFLKIISNLFTTSDFRHPVVTPSYIFIQHILSKARPRSRQDVAVGLFLVTIALEYGELSKRFLPAAFNFLLGTVFLSVPKRPIEIVKVLPPFQHDGVFSKLLTIPDDDAVADDVPQNEELMLGEDFVMTTFTTAFKLRALNTALKLINEAITLVSENTGSNYLAQPLLEMIQRLSVESYPKYVQASFAAAETALKTVATKSLTKIVPPQKKPKALRLLEPRFETVYDDKRRPKVSKAKEENLKLLHKVKRETKGAVREIRKDSEFLQKIRIKQQIESDMERKDKVKRIYAEAAVQQGELNELSRAKKKKKF